MLKLGPFSAWNPLSTRPTGLQRQAACGSGAEFSFFPTPARAKEAQEVTHSAATRALLFPVGRGGRSLTDLILHPHTPAQLSGTNVQVTRAHTFPSGINVPKPPEFLPLPHSRASGHWDQAEKVSLS